MWYAILGAVLLAGDQILKYWVVTHLTVGESAPFLPGFMQLTRLHNYGAAWSSLSGRTVLLVVFTAVLLAAVALLLIKKVVRHWTGITACTLILSGGIGNIIDRIVHGYVVDMFDLQLFSYPVFNLADCCVVVGSHSGRGYTTCSSTKNTTRKRRSLTMHAIRLTPLDGGHRHPAGQLPRPGAVEGLTRSRPPQGCWRRAASPAMAPSPAKATASPVGRSCAVTLPEAEEPEAVPQDIPLDVVYEDEDVIVVNKPVGMVVHPAPGHPDGTLVNALLHHCGDSLSGIGGEKRPGIVHRIDRDTSGLIIAAKNDAAHLALAAQLADHTLARTYECLAVGSFRQDSGTVDAPIGRQPQRPQEDGGGGRRTSPAVTHWEVLARYPGVTHLRCRLETGRTHQIRVHLAYIGHPILGDTVYGNKKPVPGPDGPMPPRHGPALSSSPYRPARGADLPPAGGV